MKKLLRLTFQWGLKLNAALTRHPLGRPFEQRWLTPGFVALTRRIRGAPPAPVAPTPEALGREWERLLGNRLYARITAIDEASATAYGEISGYCPLRGSGDVAACHRLMAYDRGLLATHGGRFVVLASQAERGRQTCQIAIRSQLLPAEDLIAAHQRKAG